MSFSVELNNFRKKSLDIAEDASRKIQLRLFRSVVFDTPVAEGTLRGNWQLGVNSSPTGTVDKNDESGNTTVADIERALASFKLGDTTYLVNNLPYAYPIEFYGWSKIKAPQGMVRKNVLRLNKIAEAVAREVNRGSR